MSINTKNVYWFHSFNRNDAKGILSVLSDGPSPYPNPETTTSKNEAMLGIKPPRVYAYLGRTDKAFGDRAIAVLFDALSGDVSPFDTGGLVAHISPVSAWSENNRKQAFLDAYTWDYSEVFTLLSEYPGESVVDYLNRNRPEVDGPAACWPDRHLPVPIWSDSENTWRAWTWEARSVEQIKTGENLVAWSCIPDERTSILDALRQSQIPESEELIEFLTEKYIDGGVAEMVFQLQAEQVQNHV